jgi:ribosome-associated protein
VVPASLGGSAGVAVLGDRAPSAERTYRWAQLAARAADDKLAVDPVVLAMDELLGVVDAFVIASGRNRRQVLTVVEEIESVLKAAGCGAPLRIEGLREASWVLMDYGDLVVHVFLEATRDYYDLEHLWSSAPRIEWREGPAAR